MTKAKQHCLNFLIWFIVIGSLTLIYFQQLDGTLFREPITFQNDITQLETDKKAYRIGEPVKVHFQYCKHRHYQADTTWRLVNETVITFDKKINTGISTLGCKDSWSEIVIIPKLAVIGPHRIEGVSAIRVNNLRTIYIEFKTVEFNVIK